MALLGAVFDSISALAILMSWPVSGSLRVSSVAVSDWMVPVLFQEDADARLFPGGVDLRAAAVEDRRVKGKVKRGELPDPPKHGFVGRARALLAIDRLLGG